MIEITAVAVCNGCGVRKEMPDLGTQPKAVYLRELLVEKLGIGLFFGIPTGWIWMTGYLRSDGLFCSECADQMYQVWGQIREKTRKALNP